jgi:hypothetical protein
MEMDSPMFSSYFGRIGTEEDGTQPVEAFEEGYHDDSDEAGIVGVCTVGPFYNIQGILLAGIPVPIFPPTRLGLLTVSPLDSASEYHCASVDSFDGIPIYRAARL